MDVLPQDGGDGCADQRAGVNEEVEHGKEALQLSLLLGNFELVTTKRHHAGLDASSANGYQQQAEQRKLHRGDSKCGHSSQSFQQVAKDVDD